ncbi:MAG: ABC transporter substrate-binding protein [Gammaproteobacteria bacterium]
MQKSMIALVAAVAAAFTATAQADIVIGSAGPMTGQYATFGEQLKRGAEMAVADINAAGGVNGEKLVLEIGDDACDPKQAVAVANQMASKKAVFVAGHFCSGSSIRFGRCTPRRASQMSPPPPQPEIHRARPEECVSHLRRYD